MTEQFDFFFPAFHRTPPSADILQVGLQAVPLHFIRNDAARRYILRLSDDGSARVTVPRRGSLKAAREFVHGQILWLEKQFRKRENQPSQDATWAHDTEILFRGEKTRLQIEPHGKKVRFANQSVSVEEAFGNLRPIVERHLRILAMSELIPRTWQLAGLHQLTIARVTVRNQRSRWGSCSVKKTISLNWRLIQTPAFVGDYIILHELMHLREMNHSRRFWREVELVCPDYAKAESWLKEHSCLLK